VACLQSWILRNLQSRLNLIDGTIYWALEAGILKIAIFELDLYKAACSGGTTNSRVGRDISCRHWKSIPSSRVANSIVELSTCRSSAYAGLSIGHPYELIFKRFQARAQDVLDCLMHLLIVFMIITIADIILAVESFSPPVH
jgi:hypothetical protein